MKKLGAFLVVALILASSVLADVSIQLKRTNPGIAGEKSAEIIFDVVNTDMGNKMEGFLLCRSPDDAVVSSSLGAGIGSGAQYVSPRFVMDVGPSQKAMSLTIDADSPGEKRSGCILKYIPFKVTMKETKEMKEVEVEDPETGEVSTVEQEQTVEVEEKQFLKMNGEFVDEVIDADYRELRLDKSVNFEPKPGAADEDQGGLKVEAPGFALFATLMGLGLALVLRRKH